jgi:hypothetical protein
MGRIPDEEIERLRKEVALEGLVRARGIDLTAHLMTSHRFPLNTEERIW